MSSSNGAASQSESGTERVAILAARSGIGQAVARRLLDRGARVGAIARDLDGLSYEPHASLEVEDLTDFAAVSDAVGRIRESFGGLTGVLNCAGSLLLKPIHTVKQEEVRSELEAHLMTSIAACHAAAKHLRSEGGSVVLISSAAASLGMPNHEIVGAAKAGVEGLVRSAAATYASRGLRFNAVAPGLVESNLTERIVSNEMSRTVAERQHPLGRIGNVDQIASAICWLLDPAQSWITGETIHVDGGLSRVQPRPRVEMKK